MPYFKSLDVLIIFLLALQWPLSNNWTAAEASNNANTTSQSLFSNETTTFMNDSYDDKTVIKTQETNSLLPTSIPSSEPSELPATAAKLVRSRRQPPYAIVKHVVRARKRSRPYRRVKRPKIRYGPPGYISGEPISSYYRPKFSTSTLSLDPPSSATYTIDEFQHLNLDSVDFNLPPSSYESQSMDLDFYSQASHDSNGGGGGIGGDSGHIDSAIIAAIGSSDLEGPLPDYKIPKSELPEEYSGIDFDINDVPPSFSYVPLEPEYKKPQQKPPSHVPHQKYGVPSDYQYATNYNGGGHGNFDSHEIGGSSHNLISHDYSSSSSSSSSQPSGSLYNFNRNHYRIAQEEKQPIDLPKPTSSPYLPGVDNFFTPPIYDPPNSFRGDSHQSHSANERQPNYSIYGKKIPNSNYDPPPTQDQHNFAEPPSKAADVEISYSPSYEINTSGYNNAGPSNNYGAPTHQSGSGQFAEPPVEVAPSNPPQHPPTIEDPSNGHHSSVDQGENDGDFQPEDTYVPPSHDLPLNPHYSRPTYDFPKSSYEVPIYDPIPFDASNNDEQEYYPPHPYEKSPTTSVEASSEQDSGKDVQSSEEQTSATSNEEPAHQENNFIPRYQQRNHNRQQGSTRYAAGHNANQRPVSITVNSSSEENRDENEMSKNQPSNNYRRTRKRKRTRGNTTIVSATASTKHILDVPELQKAFESENRQKQHPHSRGKDDQSATLDTDTNESNNVEKKQNIFITPTTRTVLSNEYHDSTAWNPMRIRNSNMMHTRPVAPQMNAVATLTTPTGAPQTNSRSRQRTQYKARGRPTESATSSSQLHNVVRHQQNSNAPPRMLQPAVEPSLSVNEDLTKKRTTSNVAILSIEKSHSKSYYDGTLPPPTLTMSNLYHTRLNRFRTPTRSPPRQPSVPPYQTTQSVSSPSSAKTSATDILMPKRTTKSVFDTTYFKSPFNERYRERDKKSNIFLQNLPKNHKLY